MSIEEIVTNRWNSPLNHQIPEQQMSSRLIDRFIRLKNAYWNREYAIVLLGIIGLCIASLQFTTYIKFIDYMIEANSTKKFHSGCIHYNIVGYFIALIPGGILSTVYPAHNILGICVTISSIGHLIIVIMSISYSSSLTICILQFCIGTTTAVADVSIYRVWTYWVPLNKQSVRHFLIVLYMVLFDAGYLHETIDKLHEKQSSYTLTLFIGVIGLAWYILWLYAINGNYSFRSINYDFIVFGNSNNSRYSSGTFYDLLTRSIVSDIPWKSICTSKPFLAIVLLHLCVDRLSQSYYGDYDSEWTMKEYTVIFLLLFVVLVELVPEITIPISTTNVRKFWSCLYFGSMGIIVILEVILENDGITNKVYQYVLHEMRYIYKFGFYINVLDIAPKYASLLTSFLLYMEYNISPYFWYNVVDAILSYAKLNKVGNAILMTIICFTAAVLYAIFASAEVQPWADEPVEENRQNMVENDN